MKVKSEQITENGTLAVSTVLGSMASRVAAQKIPMKNAMLKHGLLAVAGVAAAVFAPKGIAGKAVQGAGIGVAATQLTEVIKTILKPKDGSEMKNETLKVALGMGNPQTVYVDYYPYEEAGSDYSETSGFLSGTCGVTGLSAADAFSEI